MPSQTITRRDWLKLTSSAALISFLPGRLWSQAGDKRPNILWLSCEDTCPYFGCYGVEGIQTPNVDRIGNGGIVFTNAHAPVPVCSPTRTAIMSAIHPIANGSLNMRGGGGPKIWPEDLKPFPAYLRDEEYWTANYNKEDYAIPMPGAWDTSVRRPDPEKPWQDAPAGRPWFVVQNYRTTHEAQTRTDRAQPTHAGDEAPTVPLPPYYPDSPGCRESWRNHLSQITHLDVQIGRVLDLLDRDGLADDTIVFFWSDHGDGLPRAKRFLYDSGQHSALIVRIPEKFRTPGTPPPGSSIDDLVYLMDLGPTTLSLAGVEPHRAMHGRAVLGRHKAPKREFLIGARNRMGGTYNMGRSIRTPDYLYIVNFEPRLPLLSLAPYDLHSHALQDMVRLHWAGQLAPEFARYLDVPRPWEELYNVKDDPHNIRDLAGDPANDELKARLRRRLVDALVEHRDTGLAAEGLLTERGLPAYTPEAIREHVELALRSANPAPGDIALFRRHLADTPDYMTYWALNGLANFRGRAGVEKAWLLPLLEHRREPIRTMAVTALCLNNLHDGVDLMKPLAVFFEPKSRWRNYFYSLVESAPSKLASLLPALWEYTANNEADLAYMRLMAVQIERANGLPFTQETPLTTPAG